MIYPVGIKSNSRFRGPVESSKILLTNNDIEQNLKLLYTKFSTLETSLSNIRSVLDDSNLYKSHKELKILGDRTTVFTKEATTNG